MDASHPTIEDGDALFRALIATSVDGIIVIDENAKVLVYSQACQRLFGYSPDDVIGQNIKMLMPEPYHGEHDGYITHYKSTHERHIIGIGREVTGRRRDGSIFPMYLSVGEGRLNAERIFVGIIHDITAEKEREEKISSLQNELLHATRVTAMGQISSAIAHELNQPLSAILSYTGGMQRLIDRADPPLAEIRQGLAQTTKDASRAGEIIRRLRAFVEKREPVRRLEQVAPMILDAVSLGALGTGADAIEVDVRIAPGIPPLHLDKIQIQQVLVNLMRNAAEAMRGSPAKRLTIQAEQEEHYLLISVSDTGPGIAPEIEGRLFEAFTSTKDDGMGMGLSICRTIVEAHGGRIWAESKPGAGAIFRFRLPQDVSPA